MFPWWPKSIPTEVILPLRALGKRNLRHGPGVSRPTRMVNADGSLGPPTESLGAVRRMEWDGTLTLAEKNALKRFDHPSVAFSLARTLADGPKVFKMPADLVAGLNEIEIPLVVKEFAPPFPTTIVEQPNGKYHFVVFKDGGLSVLTFNDDGSCDWSNMLKSDRQIEDYLNDEFIYEHHRVPAGDLQVVRERDDLFNRHRFRATLNFLLLATLEAQFCVRRLNSTRRRRLSHVERVACPDVYHFQNIKLFQPRTQAALQSAPHQGGTKRPHLRRSHWRRVPTGKGRIDRKLTLIPWAFVNKRRLSDPDLAKTNYSAG